MDSYEPSYQVDETDDRIVITISKADGRAIGHMFAGVLVTVLDSPADDDQHSFHTEVLSNINRSTDFTDEDPNAPYEFLAQGITAPLIMSLGAAMRLSPEQLYDETAKHMSKPVSRRRDLDA